MAGLEAGAVGFDECSETELLSNLSEGDLRRICREQLMDGADTRQVLKARERFQNAGS